MAEPSSYRPAPGEIPTDPGVYRFRDADGRVIYVGKAKNLRNRLNSYFASPETLRPKTYAMVHTAASVEWTVVASEMESLHLEYTWIKEYAPRFNIAFRDDKSYPYLAVTVNDVYPRAMVTRGERRKGVRYFGPYSQVWAIRETLDALLTVFPVRTCTNGVFQRAKNSGRPCLLGYIDKCSAPCVGKIGAEDHRELARGLTRFMGGGAEKYIELLTKEMKEAAAQMDFERAAVLRDDIAALTKAFERNAVVLGSTVDADLFAYVEDDLEASVQVFFVRDGIDEKQPIRSMPGQYQHTLESIIPAVREAYEAGIRCIDLFGIPRDEDKDEIGSTAWDPQGILNRAIAVCREEFGDDLVVMADTCLDEFTSHGHCGVLVDDGHGTLVVDNDETVELYCKMAVSQARAGAHTVSPSGMMDGQIAAMRAALDEAGFEDVSIMAYSAKYASAFFGPFRDAVESTFKGDRKTYQQDPANRRESLLEVRADLEEGADMVMVKPAGSYLDIVREVAEFSPVPVAAYQVSGEYAMIEAAAANGWINRKAVVLESLRSIHRAGADVILTYYGTEAARWLRELDA